MTSRTVIVELSDSYAYYLKHHIHGLGVYFELVFTEMVQIASDAITHRGYDIESCLDAIASVNLASHMVMMGECCVSIPKSDIALFTQVFSLIGHDLTNAFDKWGLIPVMMGLPTAGEMTVQAIQVRDHIFAISLQPITTSDPWDLYAYSHPHYA